ncbi:MAG: flagellar biosynthesis protein FliQ [Spirochaetia bacterium]
MSLGFAVAVMRNGILQVLLMAAPVLIVSVVVGLIVSIFQATTSIQEQTLTFVPKIAAILVSLIVFGSWIFSSMREFALSIINMLPEMVK